MENEKKRQEVKEREGGRGYDRPQRMRYFVLFQEFGSARSMDTNGAVGDVDSCDYLTKRITRTDT